MKTQAATDKASVIRNETLRRVPEISVGTIASYWNITDWGKLKPFGSFQGPSSR